MTAHEEKKSQLKKLLPLLNAAVLGGLIVAVLFLWQRGSNGGEDDAPEEVATPADPIQQCDALAADPEDPRKTVEGVHLDEYTHGLRSPHEAFKACESALVVASESDKPRIYYQLSRVEHYLERKTESEGHLYKSAVGEYPAAIFAVAKDAYEAGKLEGNIDYKSVMEAYLLAAKLGHPAAAQMIEHLYNEEFPLTGYQLPGLMRAIYDGNYDAIPDDNFTRSVNLGIYEHLKNYCSQFEANVTNIITDAEVQNYALPLQVNSMFNGIAGFFKFLDQAAMSVDKFQRDSDLGSLIRDVNSANADWDNSMAYLHTLGLRDAGVLVHNHNCQGQQSNQFASSSSKCNF